MAAYVRMGRRFAVAGSGEIWVLLKRAGAETCGTRVRAPRAARRGQSTDTHTQPQAAPHTGRVKRQHLHAMLQADKAALARELRLNMLHIQWKELEYLYTNFQNLATCSAVMIGFGVGSFGLSQTFRPEGDHAAESIWEWTGEHWRSWIFVLQIVADAIFYGGSALAVSWNVLAIYIGTVSTMCGPGMALRGQEGSVSVAVLHLEAQLKRALRFFGRGIIAFTFTLVSIGLRRLHTIGAFGAICSMAMGAYTLHKMWVYGSDVAEKFYVSPSRAVRGSFVELPNGHIEWRNTPEESANIRVSSGWGLCGLNLFWRVKRWRPEGHTVFTPLWRLDKMMSFPYSDEKRLLQRMLRASQAKQSGTVEGRGEREREHMQQLVMQAQGTTHSRAVEPEDESSISMAFDAINPMQMVQMVGQALVGGHDDRRGGQSSQRA
jgi:hypothetical protein